MRIGLIDLGTASIRFEIYQINASASTVTKERIHHERHMPRLGEGLYETNELSSSAKKAILNLVREFRVTIESLAVEKVLAVATSAIREATDGAKFVDELGAAAGFSMKIITGEEEARLIAEGILANEKNLPDYFGLIDIGGGSTEISICRERSIIFSESLPLGAIRCQQLHLKKAPPEKSAVSGLTAAIEQTLSSSRLAGAPEVPLLLGSSGTVRTLVSLKGGSDYPENKLSLEDIDDYLNLFLPLSSDGMRAIPKMDQNRVDIILAGTFILQAVCRRLGAKSVRATSFSLRHGLLERAIASK